MDENVNRGEIIKRLITASLTALGLAVFAASCGSPAQDELAYIAPEKPFEKNADEGPLGVKMNMKKKDITPLHETSFNYFESSYAPRASALFDFYQYRFAPMGVCYLGGIGRDIETAPDGEMVRREFTRLFQAISRKYGVATEEYDDLRDDAEFVDPASWVKSISAMERDYSAVWTSNVDKDFPNDIGEIELWAKATDQGVGYINLSYKFDNYDACIELDKAHELDDL